MQKLLFILNESPYGTEKAFNALRFAINLIEEHPKEVEVKVFCFSDSVLSGLAGQAPNDGPNVQQTLEVLTGLGTEVKLCTSCTKARGITHLPLVKGVVLGTLDDVSEWTLWADKVINF
ncbi:DsrE/DsrF/TusD sulfur relay family protein [Mannheimia massilioguelmaensis]|uniref:DsrE/DsrF/TusD sulfur relay family protein n=1 Tax=Mannheimia massilioguelmaensis TaxID=1604354 RepID=UPI0005C98120|nr:DsrE family protein [Mannheimia massilioguelmaensis]